VLLRRTGAAAAPATAIAATVAAPAATLSGGEDTLLGLLSFQHLADFLADADAVVIIFD
jgi:hypothetical protein